MKCVLEISLSECGVVPKVDYILLRSPRNDAASKNNGDVYSLLCLAFHEDGLVDEDFTYDISSNEETANSIFNTLISGNVTPLHIKEVLYNLL